MCEVAERLRSEGRNEGRYEGKNAERIRIIQKKLEKGMNVEQIAELLELPLEEVIKLIELLK